MEEILIYIERIEFNLLFIVFYFNPPKREKGNVAKKNMEEYVFKKLNSCFHIHLVTLYSKIKHLFYHFINKCVKKILFFNDMYKNLSFKYVFYYC